MGSGFRVCGWVRGSRGRIGCDRWRRWLPLWIDCARFVGARGLEDGKLGRSGTLFGRRGGHRGLLLHQTRDDASTDADHQDDRQESSQDAAEPGCGLVVLLGVGRLRYPLLFFGDLDLGFGLFGVDRLRQLVLHIQKLAHEGGQALGSRRGALVLEKLFQTTLEVGRGLESVIRLFGQSSQQHAFDPGRDVG